MAFKIRPAEIMTLEDGYKYWWPTDYPHGCFQPSTLRSIADQLDAMNAEWDKQVMADLS